MRYDAANNHRNDDKDAYQENYSLIRCRINPPYSYKPQQKSQSATDAELWKGFKHDWSLTWL